MGPWQSMADRAGAPKRNSPFLISRQPALALGCDIIDLGPAATGEAEALATRLLETAVSALQTRPSLQRLCVLAGGETTVKVVGNGRGGRNQVSSVSIEVFSELVVLLVSSAWPLSIVVSLTFSAHGAACSVAIAGTRGLGLG